MPIGDARRSETPATVEPYPAPMFLWVPAFEAAWADAGFGPADLNRLYALLAADPAAGDVMAGTGGLRKVRLARPGEGKRGAARVCYAVYAARGGAILLFTVFGKAEKANLSKAERNAAAAWLAGIEKAIEEYDARPIGERRKHLPSKLKT